MALFPSKQKAQETREAETGAGPVPEPEPVTQPAREVAADPATRSDIVSIVQTMQKMVPPRKVTYAEYKPRTPFNPSGNRNRRAPSRVVYQNGGRVNPRMLFDEEIKLLDQLRPGRYLDKLVTVREVEGTEGAPNELHIEYAYRTPDQRLALATRVRSLVAMLRQIVNEQEAARVTEHA
jgi:hypothetical protein